jgi:hypothetical protein
MSAELPYLKRIAEALNRLPSLGTASSSDGGTAAININAQIDAPGVSAALTDALYTTITEEQEGQEVSVAVSAVKALSDGILDVLESALFTGTGDERVSLLSQIHEALHNVGYFEEDGNGNIRLKSQYGGLWAAGFISAGGANASGGGGGGGADMGRVWQDLTNDGSFNYQNYNENTLISLAHIPDISSKIADGAVTVAKLATSSITIAGLTVNLGGTLTAAALQTAILGGWTGSSSITTVGTITSGTWNGTAIPVNKGGTGLTSFVGDYRVLISNQSGSAMTTVAPNTSTTKKYLSQTGNGAGFSPDAPTWSEIEVPLASSTVRGGIKIGYSESNSGSDSSRNYALKLSSEKAYVNVPWVNTTYKLSVNGTTNGDSTNGVNLGTIYAPTSSGTSNQVVVWDGTNARPGWTGSLSLSSLTVSGTTTLNGTTDVNSTLTVGSSNASYNLNLYGELRFNGSANSALKYTSGTGIISTTDFVIGSSSSAKTLTVYGNSSLKGAVTIDGATVINNTLQVGNSSTSRSITLYGKLYFDGSTAYLNYANSGIHASVGFYSDSWVSAGGVASSSDARMKKNLRDIRLSVEQVAEAPAVEYDWVDETKGSGAGSIAQYWQPLLPNNVRSMDDGHLTMEYGNIALLSAIAIARRMVVLEEELKELRRISNVA